MRHRNKLFLIYMICVCVSSCKHQVDDALNSICVDLESVDSLYDASVLFHPDSKHKLLHLEANEDCIIGEISNVFINSGEIIIIDNLTKNIYKFDINGNYKARIGAYGRASNEYMDLTDVFVTDNTIYVLDNISQKILVYDIDGIFEYNIDISSLWGHHLIVSEDIAYLINKWSDSSIGRYRLFSIDKQGHILSKQLSFKNKDTERYYSDEVSCAASDERVVICYPSDNTIYTIDQNMHCLPYLNVDFMKNTMPEKYITLDILEARKMGITNKYIWGIDSIRLSSRYLFLSYMFRKSKYNVIYDLKTGDYFSIKALHTKDFYGLPIGRYYVSDNYLISYMEPSSFIFTYDNLLKTRMDPNNMYHKEVMSIANNVNTDGNGILILYQLKDWNNE